MKIGVSLGMNLLCGDSLDESQTLLMGSDSLGAFLGLLRSEGVTHIEIRAVHAGESAERIIAAAGNIMSAGMTFTVHGELREFDPAGFFSQIRPLSALQKEIIVTVHPVRKHRSAEENISATADALKRMLRLKGFCESGLRVAVENCRMSKEPDVSLLPDGVLESVKRADSDIVGTCWDFGHFCSDRIIYPDVVRSDLPSLCFAGRTIHTHIHDMAGSTHFPLGTGCLPLKDYISLLRDAGYGGVYNLELEPERWYRIYPDVREMYIKSVRALREAAAGGREKDQ